MAGIPRPPNPSSRRGRQPGFRSPVEPVQTHKLDSHRISPDPRHRVSCDHERVEASSNMDPTAEEPLPVENIPIVRCGEVRFINLSPHIVIA
jgi:hypothetical protein